MKRERAPSRWAGIIYPRYHAGACYLPLVTDLRFPEEVKFPGGGGEPGESYRVAARREFFQETGLRVKGPLKDVRYEYATDHGKKFYLARLAVGDSIVIGGGSLTVKEPDGQTLKSQWYRFNENVLSHFYVKHLSALVRAAAIDPKFGSYVKPFLHRL